MVTYRSIDKGLFIIAIPLKKMALIPQQPLTTS